MLGFNGENIYRNQFIVNEKKESGPSSFVDFGHVYRDPYTFHFNREAVNEQLKQEIEDKNNSWFYRLEQAKIGVNNGVAKISLIERLTVGTVLFLRQMFNYLAIEYIGGPLIFLLMMLGWWRLKKDNPKIHYLFGAWLLTFPFLLGYVVLAGRVHLMDLGFVVAGLISLGLISFWRQTKNYFFSDQGSKIFFSIIIILTLYQLFMSGRVFWSRAYDGSDSLEIKYLAGKVNEISSSIKPQDVIAFGRHSLYPVLNYLTGKSVVYFDQATIKELAIKNELQSAFDKFGVKYIIGFDQEISELIKKNSNAVDISDWPDPSEINSSISYDKMRLLNLIR